MSQKKIKRTIDILLSLTILTLLIPVCILIVLCIALNMGRPVIFSQQRPGLNGKPFMMYKFRTMSIASPGEDLSDEARITYLGRFLRSTSLDELPELINVIRGEMSLVGPRPLLMEYLEGYTAMQMRRHEALPGITGLAQIKGRNMLTWEKKFRFDIFYVDHQNIIFDFYILIMTLKVVILKKGFKLTGEEKKFY
jgi:sugar transferase EpsL